MQTSSAQTDKVRLGIVGVGNCASALVQGLAYYRNVGSNEPCPGLMSASVGGYSISNITIPSAFDISSRKIGRNVSQPIWADPNNTHRFAFLPFSTFTVLGGPPLDGSG